MAIGTGVRGAASGSRFKRLAVVLEDSNGDPRAGVPPRARRRWVATATFTLRR